MWHEVHAIALSLSLRQLCTFVLVLSALALLNAALLVSALQSEQAKLQQQKDEGGWMQLPRDFLHGRRELMLFDEVNN